MFGSAAGLVFWTDLGYIIKYSLIENRPNPTQPMFVFWLSGLGWAEWPDLTALEKRELWYYLIHVVIQSNEKKA